MDIEIRENTQTLGVIMIKEVFQARDTNWIPPVCSLYWVGACTTYMPSRTTPTPTSPSKAVNGKRVAKVMRDGTIPCQKF
jgi:hypothetical protein